MVTSRSFIHIISKYPESRHSRSSLLNTCCLLPKIPFQHFLHDLLHCSGIHLCKILLIQFHRQLHRYALWLLLFFTHQRTSSTASFVISFPILRSSTACFGFSFFPSASATCWISFCIFTFR